MEHTTAIGEPAQAIPDFWRLYDTPLTVRAIQAYIDLARRSVAGQPWPDIQELADSCYSANYEDAYARRLHAIGAIEELMLLGLLSLNFDV